MLLHEIGEPTGTNAKSSCSFDGLEYHFPNRTGYGWPADYSIEQAGPSKGPRNQLV